MNMNYFVFGTNDMQRGVSFYDQLFAGQEINKAHDEGRMTLWIGKGFMFALAEPFDGNEACVGNGTMLGINLKSATEVDDIYAKALSLGGRSEGEPKIRSGRYSAYFRDLDGNKLCIFE